MQIDGITKLVDTNSNRYNDVNMNISNHLKVGSKEGNAKPVIQGEERKYTEDELIKSFLKLSSINIVDNLDNTSR